MIDILNQRRELFNYLKRLTIGADFSNNLLIYDDGCGDLFRFVIEFIKTIYCESSSDFCCNLCPQCKLISQFSHTNIKFIIPFMDDNSDFDGNCVRVFSDFYNSNDIVNLSSWSNIFKTQKKKMIIPKFSIIDAIDFVNSDYLDNSPRICLVWGPELLNVNSANSILKVLEEPKKGCIFIMISENIDNILLTIKSRMIKVFVNDNCKRSLKIELVDVFLNILRISYSMDYEKLNLFIDDIIKNDRVGIINILKTGTFFLVDLLYFRLGLRIFNKYDDKIMFSLKNLSDIIDIKFIENVGNILGSIIYELEGNAHLRAAVFTLIVKINSEFKKVKENLN